MKKRVISGVLVATITIPLCLWGGFAFQVFCALLGMGCLKELFDLDKKSEKTSFFMQCICYCFFLLFIFIPVQQLEIPPWFYPILFLGLLLPSLSIEKGYSTSIAFRFIGIVLFFGLVFHSLIMVRNRGLWYLFYLGSIPIITDIFAYLFGKFMGKHKLSPTISPNKTIEGSIGGSAVASLACTIFYVKMIHVVPLFDVFFLTLLFSIAGQVSDLLFSKIKREYKVKDFSKLIPGHGGLLDRLDSLMLVAILYLFLGSYI